MALKGNIFSGLATFEVAAQLGSFTKAANYLHITTGAVSQQINLLEKQLSMQLFNRHSRGINLTETGQQLYQVVKRSFAEIENSIDDLKQDQSADGEIKLKLTPSFAYKWLIPRLQKFYNLYPNISIQTLAFKHLQKGL
jgi:DNA-binding transcriptional LysR family regulator